MNAWYRQSFPGCEGKSLVRLHTSLDFAFRKFGLLSQSEKRVYYAYDHSSHSPDVKN